ncbi:amino acid transporter, partial [Francisella tularensis subsp. holarctica]|nr:amino acid transporter [Francisella tularensis subsp. holarctica]
IFVSVLLIVQPAMIVWAIRTKQVKNDILSKLYLSLILFSGLGIIALQLLVSFGRLPHI